MIPLEQAIRKRLNENGVSNVDSTSAFEVGVVCGGSVEWMECALLRAALRVHLGLAGGQRAGANVPLDPFPSFSGGKVIAGVVEKLRCMLPQGFIQALEFSI